ncbi:MAG TPA: response regulator, partial [Thermoanaerobaculia bacterium]|nr:response regulator [Thermoanaerobaculia bacterium]
ILGLLRVIFETAGHSVTTTLNPQEAIALAARLPADLMILDVMMPGLSGWEVLEQLRHTASTQSLPVLMLSAIGDSSNRTRGIRMGADDFLAKPFSPDELLARAEGLISRRPAFHGQLQGRIAQNTLAEVLQTLELTQKTGELEILAPEAMGLLALVQGQVVSARLGGLSGSEAVTELLELADGTFRFREHEVALSGGAPVALHSLMIEAAWVNDELERRRPFLPQPDRELRLGTLAPIPEDFTALPITAVLDAVTRATSTLETLRKGQLAARARLDLTVAWLVETGGLVVGQPVQPAAAAASPLVGGATEALEAAPQEEETPEELDLALRELVQEALFRGLRLDPLAVVMVVAESVWDRLERWFDDLGSGLGARARTTPGLLELRHHLEGGTLLIQAWPMAKGSPPLPAAERLAALVVWLGDQPLAGAADTLLARLGREAPAATA